MLNMDTPISVIKGPTWAADGPTVSNSRSPKEFAELINGAWGKSAGGFIEAGRYLIEAKAELDPAAFKSLKLAFSESTSKKLVCIAGNPVLSSHVNSLPPNYSTLYILSQIKAEILEAAIADGRVHPGVTRKEAIELKPKKNVESEESEENPPTSPFAAAWDAAIATEAGRQDITAKLDQAGREGLCAVLSEYLRAELTAVLDAHNSSPITNANAEIAALASECSALMTHPEQHVEAIRKKLARIRNLGGGDTKKRKKSIGESNAKLDRGALARGLGLAGRSGEKTPTMNMEPAGTDASGNPLFSRPN